jgi:hypothetical protein
MDAFGVERGNDRCENGRTRYGGSEQCVDDTANARAIGPVADANAVHMLRLNVASIAHSPNPSKYVGR